MIVYRCTGCTHDHATLTPQGMNDPVCERCGRTAFAVIHLADPDEPPVTPRDMPPQVEGEEPRQVAALRADQSEEKDASICGQVDCFEYATHRFTWPGHPERTACPEHAKAATRVAEAMGFFLEVPAL